MITTVLLSLLQALNLFWLWNILRIAWRFVFWNDLEDDRSEDEEGEGRGERKVVCENRIGNGNGSVKARKRVVNRKENGKS